MIRRIEDILPPDRPEETRAPERERASRIPERQERSREQRTEEESLHHQVSPRSVESESEEEPLPQNTDGQPYIDERPPFVSRIPSREGNRNAFLDRKREERAPLSDDFSQGGGSFSRHRTLVVAGILLFLVVYLGLSVFFRKATISVTPRTEHVVLNAHVTASLSDTTKLPFNVLTLSATETKDVLAEGSKTVATKATGKIIVFNEYGSKTQRLIKNTRFQTADGKIYRITESINVPGVASVGGKQVPGRVEVTVYADGAGADYNIPVSDFTIPGLKGDPRYQKIYARGKTSMTGGFSGTMHTVADADLAKARQEIEATLKERLMAEAQKSVPADYVSYQGGMYVVNRPIVRKEIEGNDKEIRLEEEAMLYVIVFPRALLAQAIAKDAVPNYDNAPVTVSGLETLTSTITPKDDGDAWGQKELLLSLAGETRIIWNVDVDALTTAILGKAKSAFNTVLDGFPAINKGTASFRPFWWPGAFPSDKGRVEVVIEQS